MERHLWPLKNKTQQRSGMDTSLQHMVHRCENYELVDHFTCGSGGVAVELEFCPSAAMAGELCVAAQLTCMSMVGETKNGSLNVVV